ncbi:MAG: myo-inositol-1(or 4)-monophosphatase [Cellvibrionaceae bacterium]|jgi:myo-inositol-1(or 4)-monophosphatase
MILTLYMSYNADMKTPEILKVAEAIAREAGALIKKGFESEKSFSLKSSSIDLVTEFDQAAEVLIRERLNTAFPDHRIVGEEQGADAGDSSHVWYVDPIDGTTNFAHGVPHFCVSIAMYAYDRPEIGVVFNPISGELFSGATGHGATLTANDGTVISLSVTKTEEVNQALVATGFPYDRATSELDNLAQVNRMAKECRGLRRMGAAALDMAFVAAGRFDGFWEFKLGIYDVAAGIVLVREAGGQVCQIPKGKAFKPTPIVHILASGPNLKKPLLDIIAG